VDALRIPLFPLSSPVLFPGGVVPLHVFEPRYRQLTRDVLEGARVIGMAAVRPRHLEAMAGDPPLYEVGCAGVVHQSRLLADGRYHVVLRGTHRFRIREELPPEGDRLYRVAIAEVLEDRLEDPIRAERLRSQAIERMQALADRAARAEPEAAVRFDAGKLADLDPATFANTVSQALGLPAEEKQGLLEADGIVARLEHLEELLAFHLASADEPSGSGPPTVH
jgi:Lon protease-like protein